VKSAHKREECFTIGDGKEENDERAIFLSTAAAGRPGSLAS